MENSLAELERLGRLAVQQNSVQRAVISVLDISPFPMWVKKLEVVDGHPQFRMLMINTAYEITWGVSKNEYEGSLDVDIWGEEVAREFVKNDMEAVNRSPEPYHTEEKVSIDPKDDSKYEMWRIVKVCPSTDGADDILVCGIAWSADEKIINRVLTSIEKLWHG